MYQVLQVQQTQESKIEYSKRATPFSWGETTFSFHLLILFLFLCPLFFFPSLFLHFFSSSLFLKIYSSSQVLRLWSTHKGDQHFQRHADFPFYLSYSKNDSCHQRKNVQVQKSCNWPLTFYLSHNRGWRMGSPEHAYIKGLPIHQFAMLKWQQSYWLTQTSDIVWKQIIIF